jgi:hypothetical protein
MRLDKSCALFFATKIDSKLREGLALSKAGDKKYFDGILQGAGVAAVIDDEEDAEEGGDELVAGSSGPYITY